jgi:exportin-7
MRAYYSFLEIFSQEQIYTLKDLDVGLISFMIQSIAEGIRCRGICIYSPTVEIYPVMLDSSIRSQSCIMLDNIASFVIEKSKRHGYQHYILNYFKSNPTIFSFFMESIFYVLLFEDHSIQWSFSRPLLCLILLDEEVRFCGPQCLKMFKKRIMQGVSPVQCQTH